MATDTSTSPAVLDSAGRAILFNEARSANTFDETPVGDDILREIWDLARWPPTSANIQPLRVHFVRSEEAKQRLLPLLNERNRQKTEQAPVVAILSADLDFHEHVPQTFPQRASMRDDLDALGRNGREALATFNSTLQIGYFLLAARAHGLAIGPMAGFDKEGVTREFCPGGREVALLVVNMGRPGPNAWLPRLPRLDHDQVLRFS